MQDFFVGLTLLALGALVATAINHPRRFKRIYKIILGLMVVGCLFAFGHEVGFVRATDAAMPFVPANRATEAREAIDAAGWPLWGGPATFIFALFMLVALYIRPILGISEDRGKDGDGKDKPEPPTS